MKADKNSRRKFIKSSALLAIAGAGLRFGSDAGLTDSLSLQETDAYKLPPLPYTSGALEPHIDKLTMEIHHGKHHKAYVDNLNKALKESKVTTSSLEALMTNISKYGVAIRNNGGGHYNHTLFWQFLTPAGGGNPTGPVADAINSTFGTFASLKDLKLQPATITQNWINDTTISIEANSYAKDVYLHSSSNKTTFNQNYFDLMPNEKHTIIVKNFNAKKDSLQVLSAFDMSAE